MKYLEALIAYTPRCEASRFPETAGTVKVGPYPDKTGWSEAFACQGGACDLDYLQNNVPRGERLHLAILRTSHRLVCEGLSPAAVHAAFMGIEEYPAAIDASLPGARPRPGDGETMRAEYRVGRLPRRKGPPGAAKGGKAARAREDA